MLKSHAVVEASVTRMCLGDDVLTLGRRRASRGSIGQWERSVARAAVGQEWLEPYHYYQDYHGYIAQARGEIDDVSLTTNGFTRVKNAQIADHGECKTPPYRGRTGLISTWVEHFQCSGAPEQTPKR